MRVIKNCGSCSNFQKLKSMRNNSGLCAFKDCRTSEDKGHRCSNWKGIKYNRLCEQPKESILDDEDIFGANLMGG